MAREFHEFALIDWIRSQVRQYPRISLGIGDDAAAIQFPQPAECLFAVDMLMEGVHFRSPAASAREIGRKALAVNLSDIAAMAGRPLAAFVSVALPHTCDRTFAEELHLGLAELADEYSTAVAGGDTNTWAGPLVISVGVLGEATGSGPVTRHGARPGDWIMTTGEFGGSLAGKHLSFEPRVKEALKLHETVSLHSMIDVSDGLAADLHHILEKSDVGAILEETSIPISQAARAINDNQSPLMHALSDGEDFELLFTVAPDDGRKLLDDPPIQVALTRIGEIVEGAGCVLRDASGSEKPLAALGWKHDSPKDPHAR